MKYGNINSWYTLMRKIRLHPGAVTRQLLANLKRFDPLTDTEEQRVIDAINATGISTERVLATLSRNTLTEILKNI